MALAHCWIHINSINLSCVSTDSCTFNNSQDQHEDILVLVPFALLILKGFCNSCMIIYDASICKNARSVMHVRQLHYAQNTIHNVIFTEINSLILQFTIRQNTAAPIISAVPACLMAWWHPSGPWTSVIRSIPTHGETHLPLSMSM